ncbi:MAG: hypothetical protein K1X91_08960 [Bacteriodetes bacterium]|nr:hypothetical protein [Bacteroidota bacterium]
MANGDGTTPPKGNCNENSNEGDITYFLRSLDRNITLLIDKVATVRLKRTDNETEVSKKELDSVNAIHKWNSVVKMATLVAIVILFVCDKVKGDFMSAIITLLISSVFRDDVLRVFFSKSKDE